MSPERARRNRQVLMLLTGLVAGMIGLAYASVPLYELFCRVTGFGGTTQRAETAPATIADPNLRSVTVSFSADIAPDLPWRFYPARNKIEARIGETYRATYIAENLSDREITGSASFNVSPDLFGAYFVKIQCFCFERQTLKPHERVEMPVVFYLDPAMEQDAYLKRLSDVTLAYTFFRAEPAPADQSSAVLAPSGTALANRNRN